MAGTRLLIILTQLKHWYHIGDITGMVKRNPFMQYVYHKLIKSHYCLHSPSESPTPAGGKERHGEICSIYAESDESATGD